MVQLYINQSHHETMAVILVPNVMYVTIIQVPTAYGRKTPHESTVGFPNDFYNMQELNIIRRSINRRIAVKPTTSYMTAINN